MPTTVSGTILQTPQPGILQVLEDHLVTIDDDGAIVSVAPRGGLTADTSLAADEVLIPGMIDTHVHAPQWPQLGTALDLPLEVWLNNHTFPLEARFSDVAFARRVWRSMVPSLLHYGTTTAVYYASIHEPATIALAETCIEIGQRAFIGRVAMDHPDGTPEWYRDAGPSESVEASARSIEALRSLPDPLGLVQPMVTPRFIPACSDAALEGMGELAEATGALVQTHCSEGDWEHGYVLDRHGCTDSESLNDFGLIRQHTVLAHGTHLTGSDRELLVARGAGVAHCPLSNAYFSNAVFAARTSLDSGMRVGLGTDIAGGSSASLLAQCRQAVTSSRMLEDGLLPGVLGVERARIDIPTAFWLATVGGADLIGIPAGLLEPGRVFDAVALHIGGRSTVGVWDEIDDWDRIFEKLVRSSGPADVVDVWVQGKRVVSSPGAGKVAGEGYSRSDTRDSL